MSEDTTEPSAGSNSSAAAADQASSGVAAEVRDLEMQIYELTGQLNALRKTLVPEPIADYAFNTETGPASLRQLFGDRERLLVIHNMGQACRYCTLWADGFNGLLPHLEAAMAVVLVSKDPPEVQRTFANSRGWRFRLASHGGGPYIVEQTVAAGVDNMPGAVIYERAGDQVLRKGASVFGPNDQYCALWSLLGLAGLGEADFTPQYNYWRRPAELEDGGANLLE